MVPNRLMTCSRAAGSRTARCCSSSPTPLGVLELIGVIGLVWWRGRVWWGKPLLLLTVSAYAYWLLGLASFSLSGHTLLLQDTPRLIGPMLAAAGVLTIAHTAPAHRAPDLHPHRPGRAAGPRPVPARHLDRLHRMAGMDAGRPHRAQRAISSPR